MLLSLSTTIGYFNPRPREEGDPISWLSFFVGLISIHALVKRATR